MLCSVTEGTGAGEVDETACALVDTVGRTLRGPAGDATERAEVVVASGWLIRRGGAGVAGEVGAGFVAEGMTGPNMSVVMPKPASVSTGA
jgi:hypothetical protein